MNKEFDQLDNDSANNSKVDRDELALGKALQLWGSERTTDPADLVEQKQMAINLSAHQQEVEPAADAKNDDRDSSHGPSSPLRKIPNWVWSVAAMVLIAVGLSWAMKRPTSPDAIVESSRSSHDGNALTLVSSNLDQQTLLLSRFQEVFGDQIKCVSEVDGEVKVELREDSDYLVDGGIDKAEYLSVRLVLISRDEHSNVEDWAVVHEVNMLAAEESRIAIPMSKSGNVSFWAFPVDDDLVSVDLEFELKLPFEVDQASSLLEKTGEPKQLLTTKRNGIEYRLYQTIDRVRTEMSSDDIAPIITVASKLEGDREDA